MPGDQDPTRLHKMGPRLLCPRSGELSAPGIKSSLRELRRHPRSAVPSAAWGNPSGLCHALDLAQQGSTRPPPRCLLSESRKLRQRKTPPACSGEGTPQRSHSSLSRASASGTGPQGQALRILGGLRREQGQETGAA